MGIEYPVNLKVCLRPIGQPWVKVHAGDQTYIQKITGVTEFVFDFASKDLDYLTIEHFDKSSDDPVTAVEITEISFFGISDPKFAWAGTYFPDYPEPWYSQQATKPAKGLAAQTYLGWNGVYRLEFTVPVFSWMHRVLNLGWLYT